MAHPDPVSLADVISDSHASSDTFCPGCGHGDRVHAGGSCYACLRSCGYSILGRGNAFRLAPGWHCNAASKADLVAIVRRHGDGKLGRLRRARRHPAASRNTYRDRRSARNVARSKLGVWPGQVDGSHR